MKSAAEFAIELEEKAYEYELEAQKLRAMAAAARTAATGPLIASSRGGRPEGPLKALLIEFFSTNPNLVVDLPGVVSRLDRDGTMPGGDNPREAVRQTVHRLVSDGLVEKVGRGKFRLAR